MTFLEHITNLLREERGVNKLYHATGLKQISSIILHNKLVLTYVGNSDEGDDASDIISNKPGHYNFYVSLSRIPFGGYNYDRSENFAQIIIEFNASRLRQNYKIVPFNYWYRLGGYDPIKDRTTDENEDRLISNKSVIPNIVRYIDKINFYLPKERGITNEYAIMFKELVDAGIPFVIFENFRKFKSLRNPDYTNEFPKEWELPGTEISRQRDLTIMPRETSPPNNELMMLLDYMVYGEKSRWYEEDIRPIIQGIKDASEFYYDIEIHRTTNSTNFKKLLEMLSAILRKRKKSFKQLFDETKEKVSQKVNAEGKR